MRGCGTPAALRREPRASGRTETATITRCSEPSCRSLPHRALRRLRTALRDPPALRRLRRSLRLAPPHPGTCVRRVQPSPRRAPVRRRGSRSSVAARTRAPTASRLVKSPPRLTLAEVGRRPPPSSCGPPDPWRCRLRGLRPGGRRSPKPCARSTCTLPSLSRCPASAATLHGRSARPRAERLADPTRDRRHRAELPRRTPIPPRRRRDHRRDPGRMRAGAARGGIPQILALTFARATDQSILAYCSDKPPLKRRGSASSLRTPPQISRLNNGGLGFALRAPPHSLGPRARRVASSDRPSDERSSACGSKSEVATSR